MAFLLGAFAVWMREIIVFFRERERIISATITPLIWIFAFGGGLGASVQVEGMNYQTFIYPGILAMAVLFSSMFYGMYIVWDRKLDFLKAVLVAPVERSAVFFGKVLGGVSDSAIQAVVLLIVGVLAGFVTSAGAFAAALGASILLSACIVSLGLIIGAAMKSPEGFNLVMTFVMWPMFITSGALFPVENLPGWLEPFVLVNPMTYGVDLMRLAVLGTSGFGLFMDVGVLLAATAVFAAIGIRSFERMQI